MRSFSRSFLLLIGITLWYAGHAQTTHWGMTSTGGVYGVGTIFNITEAQVFTKKHDFFRNFGNDPKCDLLKATNGKLYGVTELGGASGLGTLFSYDPATGIYVTLFEFTGSANGSRPIKGLIQASTGLLYGLCSEGGVNDLGSMFSYNIGSGSLVKRVDFDGSAKGSKPRGRLVEYPTGTLHGVTFQGGANGRGVIFQVVISGHAFTKRFDFLATGVGNTGAQPQGGMVKASNNILYGCTQIGGASNSGVVYSFNTAGAGTYTMLHELDGTTDGQFPIAELLQASNGFLYGSTIQAGSNLGGTIFTWNIPLASFSVVHDFTYANGSSQFGRLIQAASGLLYGMTNRGGTNDDGVLYSFNTTGNVYTVLKNLNASGLSDAWAGLNEHSPGVFFGVSNEGGAVNAGALFSYTVASNTLTQLVPMSVALGSFPQGRLTLASNGIYYGLTSAGGSQNSGILFSYDPTSSVFTILKDLGGTNGSGPQGTMALVGDKLYGLTSGGGATGGGTLFEFNITSAVYSVKQDLNSTTGTVPLAGLIKASNGKLYGTTTSGGANTYGTIIEYTPSSNTLMKRHDIALVGGTLPKADLMQAANGSLYGTMSENGTFGNGSFFSFDPVSFGLSVLYYFDFFQGGTPAGELVQASVNNKLYGTCSDGGSGLNGNIYSWDIGTNTYTEAYFMAVNGTEGRLSESGLMEGTNGRLFTTCAQGGASDFGTIFRFIPATAAGLMVKAFAGADGQYPFDGLVRDIVPTSPAVQLDVEVFLEGPLETGTGLMNDALRPIVGFPLTEPFTSTGFVHVGGGGGETINSSVLTVAGNNAIVDWIFLEVRSGPLPSPVLATRSALLQRDGDVVDLDGVSPLSINLAAGNYKVAVRHRNHLGCMTLNEVALSSTPLTIDFTDGSTATYGTDAQKIMGAYRALWTGNARFDNELKYTGSNSDRDRILLRIGSVVPTNTVNGYYLEDVTLDGIVKYTGSFNDRDPILFNIGGSVPTNTRLEQLP